MTTRRELVNYLLTKEASRGQEKNAFISNYFKPLNKALKGEALISRIAPLGNRRIMGEFGHNLVDTGLGGLIGAGAGHLAGGAHIPEFALGGAMAGGGTSALLNQVRANRYIDRALKGSSKLSKSELRSLLEEMNPMATGFGSGGIVEFMQGNDARARVRKALENM